MVNKINVSEKAIEKFKEYASAEGKKDFIIKISVSGGCCGRSYELGFIDNSKGLDVVFENKSMKICISNEDAELLEGINLDYIKDEHGEGFKIENNKEKEGCGNCSSEDSCCGSGCCS